MFVLNETFGFSDYQKQGCTFAIRLLILLIICFFGRPANAETSIYVFVPGQSTVVQTGGFAGVHETYGIEGKFRLTVDFDAGIASFDMVDANLTEPTGFLYSQSLGEIFNMTALAGTIVDDTTIEFEGKTADGTESDVSLTLTFEDDSAQLTGKTTPPPNSADMFFYDIDAVAAKKYAGGTGEPNDPFQIATAEDLMLLSDSPEDYDKHFILTADIDLDPNLPGRKVFNKAVIGAGTFIDIDAGTFIGIGDGTFVGYEGFEGTPFTGVLDGNGHIISHLTIIGESYLGLFGQLENGATISNLGIEAVDVEGTDNCVGGLVGKNSGGIIANCYTSGNISGSWQVGGLVGYNSYGTVAYCYCTGTVGGESRVGGLVGWNDSEITKCYAATKVLGNEHVGGLVGYSDGMFRMSSEITDCYFLIARDGGGPDNGLGRPLTNEQMKKPASFFDWDFVGKPDGPHDIWAEPDKGGYPILWWQLSPLPELPFLSGKGESNDPYIISTANELNSIGHNPRIMAAHFKLINDIDLAGIDFCIIGSEIFPFTGIFDGNGHTILNFNHTSTDFNSVGLFEYVKGPQAEIRDLGLISPNINSRNWQVGSLVGYFEGGTISNCYADGGNVSGYSSVGGLVGWINGSITNCHSSTTVSGMETVGGLVGYNCKGSVTDSYSTTVVTGDRNVGGLAGANRDMVTNSYSTGEIAGLFNVGGLVGSNKYTGTISNCYSTGCVSGDRPVGGLVGVNSFGHMMNCYATATVAGNEEVGGLVGLNLNIIENCYSTGFVSGNETVGGLVGTDYLWGTAVDSFWDIETSGQLTSAGGEGKTTAKMQTASTFLEAGWDFADETENGAEDIWWILDGRDYPRLVWELIEGESVEAARNLPAGQ